MELLKLTYSGIKYEVSNSYAYNQFVLFSRIMLILLIQLIIMFFFLIILILKWIIF